MAKFEDPGGRLGRFLHTVRRSIRLYPLMVASGALLVGVALWGGFNWSLEITNTERFCISCHSMRDNVYAELKKTVHFQNRTGVRATCPDCHVPKEWVHKVIRKIRATNELYHWLKGTISTPEKFEARRQVLALEVWDNMTKTDSRECRNCHKYSFMALKAQTPLSGKTHEIGVRWGKTCIDCHKGVAHRLPRGFDANKVLDDLHDRFETEKVDCRNCHKGIAAAPFGEEW